MKRVIKIIIYLIIMAGIFWASYIYTEGAINKCVNAGHDRDYCERGVN